MRKWMILAAALAGCGAAVVETEEFERLRRENVGKDARLRDVSMRLKEKEAEAKVLSRELKLMRAAVPSAEQRAREEPIRELGAMKIRVTERGPELVVTLAGKVLFPSGRTLLTEEAKGALGEIAELIRSKGLGNMIRVEGHSDSSPIKMTKNIFDDNLTISFHRARKAYLYLVEECDLPRAQVYLAAFGDSRPVYSNETARGRDQNRRVEIVILPAVREAQELAN